MNEKIIAYIEKAVDEIFSTMIFIQPVYEKPIIRKKNDVCVPKKKDITGIVGLGGKLTASVMVHFEKESALKVTSSMLGVDYKEIDSDVIDAVGEVSNMISGGIKREFAAIGIELDQSLPIVVNGKDFDTNCINIDNSVLMPFKIDGHNMFVEFSFKD
ncbi:MAG: chemotaxis protein CheX [Actinomycetota bacterium]|nr:chemotaxis protein CheX [Actinomycetota bacterium]